MLFIVFVRLFFLRNTRGDCGEVVSQAGQRASNYMDSCEKEEWGWGIRGVIAHIPPRGIHRALASQPEKEKEEHSSHSSLIAIPGPESLMWVLWVLGGFHKEVSGLFGIFSQMAGLVMIMMMWIKTDWQLCCFD